MERKILVEVTQEELELLNKGLKEKSISDFTDDELVNEICKRHGKLASDTFFICKEKVLSGSIDAYKDYSFQFVYRLKNYKEETDK